MSVMASDFSESGFLEVTMKLLAMQFTSSEKSDEEIKQYCSRELQSMGCNPEQVAEFCAELQSYVTIARVRA